MRVPFSNNPYSVCKNRLMSSTPGLLLTVFKTASFSELRIQHDYKTENEFFQAVST
jgi:hypothetical protein